MPPKKKAKAERAPVPAARAPVLGRLSRIQEMPLDCILHIFSALSAKDLLSLSRTNKWMRNFLLNKSQALLWKQVSDAEGLPPAPADMNQVSFVALLFDKTCSVCHKSAIKADFQLKRRYCNACAKVTLQLKDINRFISVKDPLVCSMIPFGNATSWPHLNHGYHAIFSRLHQVYDDYYDVRDWEKAEALLVDFEDSFEKDFFTLVQQDWDDFVDEYIQTHPNIEEFIMRQQAINNDSYDHARVCQQWQDSRKLEKQNDDTSAKAQRLAAIKEKLKQAGYDIDALPAEIWQDKLVDQPRPLTEVIWKKIKNKLANLIEQHLSREHAEILTLAIEGYFNMRLLLLKHLDPARPYLPNPSLPDLLNFPSICQLLTRPHGNSSQINVPTTEEFAALEDRVKEEAIAWSESVVRDLLALIPPAVNIDGPVHVLLRPSTLFKIKPHETAFLAEQNANAKRPGQKMSFENAYRIYRALDSKKLLEHECWNTVPDDRTNRENRGTIFRGTGMIEFDQESHDMTVELLSVVNLSEEAANRLEIDGQLGNRFAWCPIPIRAAADADISIRRLIEFTLLRNIMCSGYAENRNVAYLTEEQAEQVLQEQETSAAMRGTPRLYWETDFDEGAAFEAMFC